MGTSLVILALLLSASPAWSQANIAEQYLFSAANQERSSRNLPLLHLDPTLTRAAHAHAEQMALHRAISHRFPDEPELAERVSSNGTRFSRVAENVAEAPTALITHDAWMRSPGHRENLLDPRLNAVGIAVVLREGQLYSVQDFAQLTESFSLIDQETAVALLLDQAGFNLIPETAQARTACASRSSQMAGDRPGFILRFTTVSLAALPSEVLHQLAANTLHNAAVGACSDSSAAPFTAYRLAILLFP